MSGLKKKHVNLTKDDVSKNIPHFSIVNNNMTREFAKNPWSKQNFCKELKQWFPRGYDEDLLNKMIAINNVCQKFK
jgi:hypothetical protein